MKHLEIKRLINGYYNGSLTTDEELELKKVVLNCDLPECESIGMHFMIMDSIIDEIPVLDDKFDNALLERLEKPKTIKGITWLSAIAATVVILFSVWIGYEMIQPKEVYGTVTDPTEAYMETKAMLFKVSEKLNQGLTPLDKTIKEADTQIEKTTKIQSLKKLDETNRLINNFIKVDVYLGNL